MIKFFFIKKNYGLFCVIYGLKQILKKNVQGFSNFHKREEFIVEQKLIGIFPSKAN